MSDLNSQLVRRILLVDDQPSLHEDYRKVFALAKPQVSFSRSGARSESGLSAASPWSFEVHSAFQGNEALGKVQEAMALNQPYAMAFIDMRMPPGWDGVETTLRLWEGGWWSAAPR